MAEVRDVGGKKIAGLVAGVAVPLALMALHPFDGLSAQGTAAFAILIGAIIWWVAEVLPDYVTALAMAALFVVVADVPASVSFSAFSSPTWWLLVCAFCMGLGMQRSGLLKRMSMAIVGKFPHTFRAQAIGLMAAAFVSSPFIPSLSAKCAVLTPLALSISDQMGYERKGRQANGLFLALFTVIRNMGPAVISASFVGYVVLGLLPEDVQQQFGFIHWFLAALPWLVMVTALNFAAIMLMFEPREERAARRKRRKERAAVPAAPAEGACEGMLAEGGEGSGEGGGEGSGAFVQPLEALGPMSLAEKQMLLIVGAAVAMWVLEPWHGVPAYVVAVFAVVAMVFCGQFKIDDLRGGIAWDNILFIGVVLGLASVLSYVGVDAWMVGTCTPALTAFAGNSYAVVAVIAVITLALRFVIVSETAFINLFMVFAVPLAAQLGLSPWVIGFCVYAMVNPWFTVYQNQVYLAAIGSVDGKMTDHTVQARFCAVYMAICFVSLLASVPYWQFMGLA